MDEGEELFDEFGDTDHAEDVDAVDPDTLDTDKIRGMVGCGLAIAAVPFVGGAGMLGLGMAAITLGGNKLAKERKHLADGGISDLAGLRVGDEARVRGEVVEGPSVSAPLGDQPAVLVQCSVLRSAGNVGSQWVAWEENRTVPFVVRCDAGTVRVDAARAAVLTMVIARREWHGSPPDEVAEVMGGAANRLETTYRRDNSTHEYRFDYVERGVVAGDAITLQGKVMAVEHTQGAGDGYRGTRTRTDLALAASHITDRSDRRLRLLGRAGRTERFVGLLYLALSVLNFAGFGYWFFG